MLASRKFALAGRRKSGRLGFSAHGPLQLARCPGWVVFRPAWLVRWPTPPSSLTCGRTSSWPRGRCRADAGKALTVTLRTPLLASNASLGATPDTNAWHCSAVALGFGLLLIGAVFLMCSAFMATGIIDGECQHL